MSVDQDQQHCAGAGRNVRRSLRFAALPGGKNERMSRLFGYIVAAHLLTMRTTAADITVKVALTGMSSAIGMGPAGRGMMGRGIMSPG
jgi:hypothetical protein